MPDLAPFCDIETILMLAYADLVEEDHVVTVTPSDLENRLPLIRVHRIGGADTRIFDQPRVVVEVYAPTWAVAWPLAERCRQRLITGPVRTSAGVIGRTTTEVGPADWPYENPDIRLVRAIYRSSLRRRTSA